MRRLSIESAVIIWVKARLHDGSFLQKLNQNFWRKIWSKKTLSKLSRFHDQSLFKVFVLSYLSAVNSRTNNVVHDGVRRLWSRAWLQRMKYRSCFNTLPSCDRIDGWRPSGIQKLHDTFDMLLEKVKPFSFQLTCLCLHRPWFKRCFDWFPSKSVKVFRTIGWVSIPSKSIKVFDTGLQDQTILSKKTLIV